MDGGMDGWMLSKCCFPKFQTLPFLSFPVLSSPMSNFDKVVFALVSLAGSESSLILSAKTTLSKWLIGKLYRGGKEKEPKGKGKKKKGKGLEEERKGKERKGRRMEKEGKRKGKEEERKGREEERKGRGKERKKERKGESKEKELKRKGQEKVRK